MGTRRRVLLWTVVMFVGVGLVGATSYGLEPENVLVIYNDASHAGVSIAAYYEYVHPGVRLLPLTGVPVGEAVSADFYLNTIRPQVLPALDGIDCIVTTKGLPLRIDNPGSGTSWRPYSSLESELTRIDTIDSSEEMGDQEWLFSNLLARNPYYDAKVPFSHAGYGTRLTARLDGFTAIDVLVAIDRARLVVVGKPGGSQFLLDDDPYAPAAGVDRMFQTSGVLAERGLEHHYEPSSAFVGMLSAPALGYVSHGIYGGGSPAQPPDVPSYVLRDLTEVLPANGAVFASYESFNAYSFTEGGNRNGQALLGEWIAKGGTAGVGYVEEPRATLFDTADESKLFEMLLEGYTWAEAAWNSIFQLSYVNTVIGDPLMRWDSWVEGDCSLDGMVDGLDYIAWSNDYLQSGWLPTDLNGDAYIDGLDYTIWSMNYGTGIDDNLVPAPASLAFLLLGAALMRQKRRALRQ